MLDLCLNQHKALSDKTVFTKYISNTKSENEESTKYINDNSNNIDNDNKIGAHGASAGSDEKGKN